MSDVLLNVVGLTKRYFAITAVDDLSFGVRRGTITGLIGPNGSGKSTTIDCISGFQASNAGAWTLDGIALAGHPPERHAAAGLVRTFQMVRSYDDLTVLENLLVAVQASQRVGWIASLLRTAAARAAESIARDAALAALAAVNLVPYADAPAQVLSYGQRKLLSIAALLVVKPKLAILDEPVSGINPTMIERVAATIRDLRAAGTTILLVEHNMDLIMSLCDDIIVLVGGRQLTAGPPAEIRSDARVLEAYLGADLDAAATP